MATKADILALINAKIAGQGSAVDAGGALPAILKGITDLIPESGGGGGSLEFANVVANPEPYVSFEVFVEWGFTEEVYSKLCSGEYAGFVTENGGRYLIVATYPENADNGTPAGFAYCDNDGRVFNTEADYENETIKITEMDGVSVVEISSLPESGSYSAQQMAEYGITRNIAQLISVGYIVGLARRTDGFGFYGIECAYEWLNPETGNGYITIVLRSGNDRYKIVFSDNGSAVVSVESVNGGGGETVVNMLEEPVFDSAPSEITITDYFNSEDVEKLFAGEVPIVKIDSENASGEFAEYTAKTWLVATFQGYGTKYLYLIGGYLKGYCFYYDDADGGAYYAYSFNWRAGSIQLSELPNSGISTQDSLDDCGLTTDAIHSLASGNVALTYVERGTDSLRLCILGVYWEDETNYTIAFQSLTTKYVIENSDGTITVTVTPLS